MNGTNDELFVKVLAQIEREPQRWDQSDFGMHLDPTDCGTAFCFAGWAVHLSGRSRAEWAEHVNLDSEVLGLRPTEASRLFFCHNNLNDLYRVSAAFMGIDEQVLRDKVAAELQAAS